MPARFVIHTVGPIWHGGNQGEADLLIDCYLNSLRLATDNRFTSIAFPSISTGVYGYPIEQSAKIAVTCVQKFMQKPSPIEKVIFCCYSQNDLDIYQKALNSG